MAGAALIDFLQRSAPTRATGAQLHVAFSGGLDSTVLLHALAGAGLENLVAVHVHHGLQTVADDWATHCESVCRAINVPFQARQVQVRNDGRGLEAAARAARYEALKAGMKGGDVLVTAHHRGDQAETVLLNLIRGSGPTGLGGMSLQREFGPGLLWRPFLEISRDRLIEFARQNRLRWVEDPHNREPRFARSFLRAEVFPRLAARWPCVEESLGRAATLAAESAELLRETAQADLRAMPEARDSSISVAALSAMTAARRRNLLREWVNGLRLGLPGHDTLMHLERDVMGAARDAVPVLAWSGGEFRRHRDRLYAMESLPPVPEAFETEWDGRSALELPAGCGGMDAQGMRANPPSPMRVRLARPSDRFRPRPSGRTRTLKNLFQERGVPVWVRERTPLLTIDRRPVWVGGFGWSAEAASWTKGFQITWRHRLPGASVGT